MARDNPVRSTSDAQETLPNLVTVVGQGSPSSFELTVDGDIEMLADDPLEEATVISGTTAEGAIDVGVQQFRFSGDMTTVTFIGDDSRAEKKATVHVEYQPSNPSEQNT